MAHVTNMPGEPVNVYVYVYKALLNVKCYRSNVVTDCEMITSYLSSTYTV